MPTWALETTHCGLRFLVGGWMAAAAHSSGAIT
jgi:hypothetical protein